MSADTKRTSERHNRGKIAIYNRVERSQENVSL